MDKDEALVLALEALEEACEIVGAAWTWRDEKGRPAITAIKQALAAPVQEPVAWMFEFPDKRVKPKFDSAPHGGNWQPLYIHPQPDAYGYAKRLSEAIWKKHYQSTAPQWEPFDDLMGVLTQIDNMTAGLITPPAQEFVCSTGLCRFTLTQTNVGIGERGMEAYEAAKKRGWVGVSDERMMEMPKQEPHSWYSAEHDEWMTNKTRKEHEALKSYTHRVGGFDLPLYTTPPQRKWVGLTDEEIWDAYMESPAEFNCHTDDLNAFYAAIEAKLKERNHD